MGLFDLFKGKKGEQVKLPPRVRDNDEQDGLPPGVRRLRSLEGHQDKVTSVAFDPAGTTLVSGSEDGTIRFWDAESGRLLRSLKAQSTVYSVVFDAAGATAANGSGNGTIEIWESKSGQLLCSLKGHESVVGCIAFDPAGTTLASGSFDRTIKLWETKSGQLVRLSRATKVWSRASRSIRRARHSPAPVSTILSNFGMPKAANS